MNARKKQVVLDSLFTHFKMYGLKQSITEFEYYNTVSDAIPKRHIKLTWQSWPRVINALFTRYPELSTSHLEKPKKETPKVEKEDKGLEALKSLNSKKEISTDE